MSHYLRATVALTSAVAGAVLFVAPAFAQSTEDPVSGDDRATAHAGNTRPQDCATLYPGSHDVTGALTSTDDGTYLDITAIADGVEVVGVIVKGSAAYNQYDVTDLGALSWLDLHSPVNASGEPAAISHWHACGVDEVSTTTPPNQNPPATPPGGTETTTPPGGSSEVSGAPVTPTTSVDVAQADKNLASTGFAGGWLITLAAGLLLAGGAMLMLVRRRAHNN